MDKKKSHYCTPHTEIWTAEPHRMMAFSALVDGNSYELEDGGNASDADCPPLDIKEFAWNTQD